MWARIENGNIVETTTNIRAKFPNTSFPNGIPESHEDWKKVQIPAIEQGFRAVVSSEVVMRGNNPVLEYTYEKSAELEAEYKRKYFLKRLDGGMTVTINGNDIFLPTTERDRILIGQAANRSNIKADPTGEYNYYPSPDVKITITNQQFIDLGLAVADHVQACYDARYATIGTSYDTPEDFEAAWEAAYNQ